MFVQLLIFLIRLVLISLMSLHVNKEQEQQCEAVQRAPIKPHMPEDHFEPVIRTCVGCRLQIGPGCDRGNRGTDQLGGAEQSLSHRIWLRVSWTFYLSLGCCRRRHSSCCSCSSTRPTLPELRPPPHHPTKTDHKHTSIQTITLLTLPPSNRIHRMIT